MSAEDAVSTEAANVVAAPARKSGTGRRVPEWFWRGAALRAAKLEFSEGQAEHGALEARARKCLELARRGLAPGGVPGAAGYNAVTCDLLRQAVHWALAALSANRPRPEPELQQALALGSPDSTLASAVPRGLHADVASALSRRDFQDCSDREYSRFGVALAAVADNLLATLERPRQKLWLVRFQRGMRVGTLAMIAAALAILALNVLDQIEQRADLARDKAWIASSIGAVGCQSPLQVCEESPGFFFHTQQERNPWFELDLGAITQISAVRADNRKDCCAERASPLVVEVSLDHRTWKEVARREGQFRSWKASFPTQKARWVKLRIPSQSPTTFHLAGVRVLP